jgi:alkylmercury lyase
MGAAHEAGPRNKSTQRSMMSTGQVSGVVETGLFDIEPSATKLLLRIWRALADGRAVSSEHSADIISELGSNAASAHRFLDVVCERNPAGDIVGAVGLSLDGHPYHFRVNGVNLRTWCAVDTLFLPAMLGMRAEVTSLSPLSGERISLIVDSTGVQHSEPQGIVVSLPIVDAADVDTDSARGIQSTFCCRAHFFTTRNEGERWAVQRGDVEIVSLDEGFRRTMQRWSKMLKLVIRR